MSIVSANRSQTQPNPDSPSRLYPMNSQEVPTTLTDKLVEELGPRLYRYFYASFESHLAADLTQEVFLRLVPKIRSSSIRAEKGNIITYAYGIAHNVRKETLRSRSRDIPTASPPEIAPLFEDPIFQDVHNKEEADRLRSALGGLKASERDIILLLLDTDMNLEAIAKTLNMPLGTVKSHIHRAKIRLRGLLDPIQVSN